MSETKEKLSTPSRRTPSVKQDTENIADRSTQDRVHAWYQSHGVGQANNAAAKASTDTAAPVTTPGTGSEKKTNPDTSVVPRKATVADFDRAAAKQSESIRKAAEQAEHQTTEVDDAGAAEASGTSHIPRTAPTERVPTPFVHGDLPGASSKDISPGDRRLDPLAPVSRLTKPAAMHAPVVSATDDEVLSHTPLALPIATPKDTRAIAAEISGSPTPRLDLPAPPVVPAAKRAPAIAAIKAGSRAPQLDPEVVDGMTAEIFGGNTPTDPRLASHLAVALASGKVSSTSIPGRKISVQDGDDTGALQGTSSPVNVSLYDGRGRLVMIPPMKGSHEILVHQNQMALSDGLDRIQDDDELAEMRRAKLLVSLPDSSAIGPDDRLPLNRRYARPWTVHFLQDLGRAHYARFGSPLIITSAARTVEFQRHLVRVNGNAAPPTGDVASPHLYGQAVDLGKHGMGMTEIAWMRAYLTPVEDAGKIDVEEEFQQSCFHISVYRRYLGAPSRQPLPRTEQAPSHPTMLQAKAAPAQKHHHLPTALLATRLP